MSNQDRDNSGSPQASVSAVNRRAFMAGAAAAATSFALPNWASAWQDELGPVRNEISRRHEESLKRLQTWIKQPSIAAENRGINEGCELTMNMLREAGF